VNTDTGQFVSIEESTPDLSQFKDGDHVEIRGDLWRIDDNGKEGESAKLVLVCLGVGDLVTRRRGGRYIRKFITLL